MEDFRFSKTMTNKELYSPYPLAAGEVYESESDPPLLDFILADKDDPSEATLPRVDEAISNCRNTTRTPLTDITCEVITRSFPLVQMRETLGPPGRVAVGCEIAPTFVELDLDSDFFSDLSTAQLTMKVRLLPADRKGAIPASLMPRFGNSDEFKEPSDALVLNGTTLFCSVEPNEVTRYNRASVLRFRFSSHAMWIPTEGQFHLSYDVPFHDNRGQHAYAQAFSRMFSTYLPTNYTPEEIKALTQQQSEGNIRLRQVGYHAQIDLLNKVEDA